MHVEEHNHCFMLYFGVKTLSETPFPPPLMNAGYGARLGAAEYETVAYEFHAPSEHTIDGQAPHRSDGGTWSCVSSVCCALCSVSESVMRFGLC